MSIQSKPTAQYEQQYEPQHERLRRPGQPSDSREERKYPVPEPRAPLLAAWLRARLRPDPQYPVGVITSCYFDTPALDAYWDSVDGQRVKSKLRMRWYGDPVKAWSGGWIEVKQRDGAESSKRRIRLDSDALRGANLGGGLVLPERRALACYAAELDPSLAASVEPTILIRYERQRWRDEASGLRVSLDSRVRIAPTVAGGAWRPLPRGTVLELKSTGPLPLRLHGLQRFGLLRTAHSKYVLAVEQLLGGVRARTA